MQSDFTNINVVPIGNEFFDLVLPPNHCQTPNLLLRKGFEINRLRQSYTREVKKTELRFRDKLSTIIDEFPRIDEINPLYTDLLRLIFDRDRYKLALGQVSTAKHLVTKIANDYVKQLAFSESLKQCKTLKAGAIGRMFSVVNEITPSLAYLEQLRQHMVKLPSIDPNSPTLLISGFPNVDKTCFMNRINTEAGDFVGKSVNFVVGHTDYKDLVYQVIDAPGVLDRSFSGDCNVVISALSRHLRASLVVFFLDVSCSCGYSIAYQAALFYSLKSLFVNKPLLIVCDETDLMEISENDWKLIQEMNGGLREEEVVLKIRNLSTEEGVMSVKNAACERLLDHIERLSCIAQRNKCILTIQEWKDDIIPPNLDGDDHNDSGLLVDSDVLVKLEELEHEEGLNQFEDEEEEGFVMAEECFRDELNDQIVAIYRGDSPSCTAREKVECWRNKYVVVHQEWKDDIIPQYLDDDHKDSDLLVDLECEEGPKKAEEEEEDGFVMAEERFTEEHKDHQLVTIRKIQPLRILIALAFFILVGNTYGTIQQCLSALSFRVTSLGF